MSTHLKPSHFFVFFVTFFNLARNAAARAKRATGPRTELCRGCLQLEVAVWGHWAGASHLCVGTRREQPSSASTSTSTLDLRCQLVAARTPRRRRWPDQWVRYTAGVPVERSAAPRQWVQSTSVLASAPAGLEYCDQPPKYQACSYPSTRHAATQVPGTATSRHAQLLHSHMHSCCIVTCTSQRTQAGGSEEHYLVLVETQLPFAQLEAPGQGPLRPLQAPRDSGVPVWYPCCVSAQPHPVPVLYPRSVSAPRPLESRLALRQGQGESAQPETHKAGQRPHAGKR